MISTFVDPAFHALFQARAAGPHLGQIQYFGSILGLTFAVISLFRATSHICSVLQNSKVIPVVPYGNFQIININSIVRKCVFVCLSSQSYVCIPPNDVSHD